MSHRNIKLPRHGPFKLSHQKLYGFEEGGDGLPIVTPEDRPLVGRLTYMGQDSTIYRLIHAGDSVTWLPFGKTIPDEYQREQRHQLQKRATRRAVSYARDRSESRLG